MEFTHLALANFRSYARLELDLPPGIVVIQGGNAQGKTNLLEAIYVLATTRSFRGANERELLHWAAGHEEGFARIEGHVQRRSGPLTLELTIRVLPASDSGERLVKRIRVNGVGRRAIDFLGMVKVVAFSPQDLELVSGPPQSRRRYLDLTLCLLDPEYFRTLVRYQRVLQQRNHLLRQIQAGRGKVGELSFWDDELISSGLFLSRRRQEVLVPLADWVSEAYRDIAGDGEPIQLRYQPSIADPTGSEEVYRQQLERWRRRELEQGLSLVGPHRDELLLELEGASLRGYGSRAQQRSAVIALRLAEMELFRAQDGEPPILLLDDVLSELDDARRRYLAERLYQAGQVLITTADLHAVEPTLLQKATLYRAERGMVLLRSAE